MAPSDMEQEPTPESISSPVPGDALEESADPINSAMGVNVQNMMLLAELVSSVTREMKGVLDTVERCLSEARTLAESEGIKLDEDIGLSLNEIAESLRSVAKQSEHIAGVAVVALSQSLAQMGAELQKAVIQMAVAELNSGPHTSAEQPQSNPKREE